MYLRLVLSWSHLQFSKPHKGLMQNVSAWACVLFHTVSWFSDKASSIIFEPPPSFRASGGVCRSRASHRSDLLHHLQNSLNYFHKGGCILRSLLRWEGDLMPIPRPDRSGSHQQQFRINKKKIYATQTVCGICGKPVDFSLKYPHPLSACIDHIIPIAKGGHPSDISNLQLAHWCCNRQKSDKLVEKQVFDQSLDLISNRILPQCYDWKNF